MWKLLTSWRDNSSHSQWNFNSGYSKDDDDDSASRSVCRPASKWIQRTRRSLTTIIHSSVSEMDSSSADSAFNFLLIFTFLSISSRSSLSSHLPLLRLLFLTNLRSFFFFPSSFVIQALIVFPLCLLFLWGFSVFHFFPLAVREGLLRGLLRFRPFSGEIQQLCNELSLIFFWRRSFFFFVFPQRSFQLFAHWHELSTSSSCPLLGKIEDDLFNHFLPIVLFFLKLCLLFSTRRFHVLLLLCLHVLVFLHQLGVLDGMFLQQGFVMLLGSFPHQLVVFVGMLLQKAFAMLFGSVFWLTWQSLNRLRGRDPPEWLISPRREDRCSRFSPLGFDHSAWGPTNLLWLWSIFDQQESQTSWQERCLCSRVRWNVYLDVEEEFGSLVSFSFLFHLPSKSSPMTSLFLVLLSL